MPCWLSHYQKYLSKLLCPETPPHPPLPSFLEVYIFSLCTLNLKKQEKTTKTTTAETLIYS